MNWEDIVGQDNLKKILQQTILENRISHAQLFVGKEGYGGFPLALGYSQAILSRDNATAASKVSHYTHLDLHFSFPVFTSNGESLSKTWKKEFVAMMRENPYACYDDWSRRIEAENKQNFISVAEVNEVLNNFAITSFEGGARILIIWNFDKINEEASNKLLKFLEEPPKDTYIFMTASGTEDILPTILSRTQIIQVPMLSDVEVEAGLINKLDFSKEDAHIIAKQAEGNMNTALKIAQNTHVNKEFEELFVQWVRDAFQVKKKPEFLKEIVFWARNIASWNKEKQLSFLQYCIDMFRFAMLQNYQLNDLVVQKIETTGFNWNAFSGFVSGANIPMILEEINTAELHLSRNGNANLVWTDMGIKLSRYIHQGK